MSFALPAAFALLATVLLVILFALLRSRRRRREVATFFVWRELRDSLSARTQRLRALLDPLLLLQVATVIAAVFALAQPLVTSRQSGFSSLAIVIDSSASMSTRMDSGLTRYEAAVQRASEILATCPTSSVSVVLFSRAPRTLAANDTDPSAVRKSLSASTPSWEGDGRVSDLIRGLEGVGGPSNFEQIVFLGDHPLDGVPFPMRVETFTEGTTVALTAFSVRENPDGAGVSAFAELYNGTPETQALQVVVTDERSRTTVDTFLEPGERSSYVIPFPTSRGSRFTASIAAQDAFAGDDVRYASVHRSAELRVRWLGKDNRYLAAALDAVAPIARVDAAADLTVVYDVDLDALPEGNVFLVHSNVRDVITLSERTASGTAAATVDDALLAGVQPADIYVESLPVVDVLLPFSSLLTVAGNPFLVRIQDPTRLVLVLPSDLTVTNLPITVDFPLLVRNLVGAVMPEQPTKASRWALVGSPVALRPAPPDGPDVSDPQGRTLALLTDQRIFFPDRPGQYSIRYGSDAETVSVNVDPGESSTTGAALGTPASSLPPLSSQLRDRRSAGWPVVAGALFLLLVAEWLFHQHRQREEGIAG